MPDADAGNKWTVPFGGGFGKVFRLGSQPFNANTQAFYNVRRRTTPVRIGSFVFSCRLCFPGSGSVPDGLGGALSQRSRGHNAGRPASSTDAKSRRSSVAMA